VALESIKIRVLQDLQCRATSAIPVIAACGLTLSLLYCKVPMGSKICSVALHSGMNVLVAVWSMITVCGIALSLSCSARYNRICSVRYITQQASVKFIKTLKNFFLNLVVIDRKKHSPF
jgi:formate hydrogenlyase subunit 4